MIYNIQITFLVLQNDTSFFLIKSSHQNKGVIRHL